MDVKRIVLQPQGVHAGVSVPENPPLSFGENGGRIQRSSMLERSFTSFMAFLVSKTAWASFWISS